MLHLSETAIVIEENLQSFIIMIMNELFSNNINNSNIVITTNFNCYYSRQNNAMQSYVTTCVGGKGVFVFLFFLKKFMRKGKRQKKHSLISYPYFSRAEFLAIFLFVKKKSVILFLQLQRMRMPPTLHPSKKK